MAEENRKTQEKPAAERDYREGVHDQWDGLLGVIKKYIDEVRYKSSTREPQATNRLVEAASPGAPRGSGERFPRAAELTLEDWVALGRPSGRASIVADMPGPGPEKMALGRSTNGRSNFTWIGRDGKPRSLDKPEGEDPLSFYDPRTLKPRMEQAERGPGPIKYLPPKK